MVSTQLKIRNMLRLGRDGNLKCGVLHNNVAFEEVLSNLSTDQNPFLCLKLKSSTKCGLWLEVVANEDVVEVLQASSRASTLRYRWFQFVDSGGLAKRNVECLLTEVGLVGLPKLLRIKIQNIEELIIVDAERGSIQGPYFRYLDTIGVLVCLPLK
jgi:hypothetical protein